MINAEPQRIDASKSDLESLATRLTAITIWNDAFGRIAGVWLWRGDQSGLFVTSDSRDIVFKFEVFTLGIRDTDDDAIAPYVTEAKVRATSWPFSNWKVDVLWARDWSISLEALPEDWVESDKSQQFGQVPDGADHACFVAEGLMFTGLASLIHDARFRVRSGHLLRLAVLRGRPASLAFVSPHSD
ncbi:hypothetical protein [Sphingobium yanoikuyae]|uniref:hypothetical protein n=1 Tax=Sphingobium yanoikuyae TaxID=13690 RepID=UPI001916D104|nr:hypothetical protein [Sphingobium yanoikuyae]